jgi:CelD/BcsL family acetyltransferase involved in cellulose biosynthesis
LNAGNFQIDVVESSSGFVDLEHDWRDLYNRAKDPHYFQSFDWLYRAWKHIASARDRKLSIVVGRCNGRVVLIWPLMRDGLQIRLLASDKAEYRGLIVEDGPQAGSWIQAAWDVLATLGDFDVLHFQDVQSSSPLGLFLRGKEGVGWKHEKRSHVVRLDRFADWDDYAQTLPKKMLRDQQRQWRRLAATGEPIRLKVIDSKEELEKGLDWLLCQKRAQLKAKRIKDTSFDSQEYTSFVCSVILHDFKMKNHVYFIKLCVGETIISAGYGYKSGGVFTFYMFAYDIFWQTYSPGRLLLEHILRWCFQNGVVLFDFMPGEENYKTIWANDEFGITDYILPVTLRGSAMTRLTASVLPAFSDKEWLHTVSRWLPDELRRNTIQFLYACLRYSGRLEKL